MTLITIKKVNGVPMGRPKNPYTPPNGETPHPNSKWHTFEQSVTEHEAPGCEEGEAEGELVWQHFSSGHSEWYECDEGYDHLLAEYCGEPTRQIWIVSTPEKVEVKEVDNWIRVEDRLPEDGRFYLICYKSNDYYRCGTGQVYIRKDGSKCFVDDNESAINVTHWQPLPSPPTH